MVDELNPESSTTDSKVVQAFVEYLRDHGRPDLKIDRWPDKENREKPDIDAIAGPFAIEHTSIDSVENQRRDADGFERVVTGLDKPDCCLDIVIPYGAIPSSPKKHWPEIRKAFQNWVTNVVPKLADGKHSIAVEGIPFEFSASKSSDRPPGIYFARVAPKDGTLSSRVKQAFYRKARKLEAYQRQPGVITVLLIESDDIALMNQAIMLEAMREACPSGLPSSVNQLWYAETAIPNYFKFWDFTPFLVKVPLTSLPKGT